MSNFCDPSCLFIDETEEVISRSHNGASATLGKCKNCGYRVFLPLPSQERLNEFYAHEYWEIDNVKAEALNSYTEFEKGEGEGADCMRRLDTLFNDNNIKKAGLRIHDVGCGYGLAVYAFNKAGARATGSDLSEQSIRVGQSIGNTSIFYAKAEDYLSQCEEKIDIIFMSHSLEHMLDPAETIRSLMPFLADDGLFIILVPNGLYVKAIVDSFNSWQWFSYPNHLHYFTPKSLNCLFHKTGMRLIDVTSGTLEPWPDDLAQILFHRTKEQIPDWESLSKLLANNVMGAELQVIAAKSSSVRQQTDRSVKILNALGNEKHLLSTSERDTRQREQIKVLQVAHDQILKSFSWKVTAPLRIVSLVISKVINRILRTI